jgi:dTDP-4-dehydrorhamnose 3,5-epimerase-like enzyme
MKTEEVTQIADLIYIEHDRIETPQGSFQELYRCTALEYMIPLGIAFELLNTNTVRGLHRLNSQRLVHVTSGGVFLAVVDLRDDSDTFNNVYTVDLDTDNSVLVPEYCAMGLLAYEKSSVLTLLDDVYDPGKVEYIHWKSFNIKWPKRKRYHLMDRDQSAPKWSEPLS